MKAAAAVCALLALAAGVLLIGPSWHAERDLRARLEQRVPFPSRGLEPCPAPGGRRSVILVLGQSNAGNHGAEEQPLPVSSTQTVLVSDGQRCVRTSDPLPGATGRHRSLWTKVASNLRAEGYDRELILMVLAVDSTTIGDWTRPSSRLRTALEQLLATSTAGGVRPDLVIWQQGESDARSGTSADDYARGLQALASIVRGAGVDAPIVAALSTRCGEQGPSKRIRSAIAGFASQRTDIKLGPDTDLIAGSSRNHDCHFTEAGLDAAAGPWARTLVSLLPRQAGQAD